VLVADCAQPSLCSQLLHHLGGTIATGLGIKLQLLVEQPAFPSAYLACLTAAASDAGNPQPWLGGWVAEWLAGWQGGWVAGWLGGSSCLQLPHASPLP